MAGWVFRGLSTVLVAGWSYRAAGAWGSRFSWLARVALPGAGLVAEQCMPRGRGRLRRFRGLPV
eukprot:6978161-Pyramimonas_sp.AAC.1